MIRIFYIQENFDIAAELKHLLPRLPQWRFNMAISYCQDIDKFLCAKSFLMLEDMFRESFGLNYCPKFSYDSCGKPYLADYQEIYFNISHCHKGIACAVMDKPVGIDIEAIQFDEDLANVIFNTEELDAIKISDEPAVKFTELWTRKESFLKLTGEGLRDNLKNILSDVNKTIITTEINRPAGYVYSIAVG